MQPNQGPGMVSYGLGGRAFAKRRVGDSSFRCAGRRICMCLNQAGTPLVLQKRKPHSKLDGSRGHHVDLPVRRCSGDHHPRVPSGIWEQCVGVGQVGGTGTSGVAEQCGWEGKRMVSGFIGNEVLRKELRVRVSCPPPWQLQPIATCCCFCLSCRAGNGAG